MFYCQEYHENTMKYCDIIIWSYRLPVRSCLFRVFIVGTLYGKSMQKIIKFKRIHILFLAINILILFLLEPKQFMLLTNSISHAIEENPVSCFWSVFDKGNVVASLYTQHSKQLQFFSWRGVRWTTRLPHAGESFWKVHGSGLMGPPAGVQMNLRAIATCNTMKCFTMQ